MKTLFLLGAGASTPFLRDKLGSLDTKRLTETLLDPSNWEDILAVYEKIRATARYTSADNISYDDIEVLLKRITSLLGKTVQFENYNFEHVIHFLDRFSFYLSCDLGIKEYSMIDILPIMFWTKVDFDLKKKFYSGTGHQGWRYVPFLAREIIVSTILQIWNNAFNKDDAIKLYRDYFDELLTRCDAVNVYSLNYDPLIYSALKMSKGYFNGFTHEQFDIKEFFDKPCILAFLHGHIGFVYNRFEDDYIKAQENRLNNMLQSSGFYKVGMKGVSLNTSLITGLDKFDAFSRNPFASYFQRFGKDIIESQSIVVLGSSLHDDHLNTLLINYFIQSGKKVIYVTKMCIDQIKRCLSHSRPTDENPILELTSLFEKNYFSYQRTWDEHVNELCESVNKNGYGKLTDYVVLYACGSENFLNRKQDLRSILDILNT